MIPPSQLIGIDKFDSWYPGQQEIWGEMMAWVNDPRKRFAAASIPTAAVTAPVATATPTPRHATAAVRACASNACVTYVNAMRWHGTCVRPL